MIDKEDATVPETQEDEQDARDAEEARQDVEERVEADVSERPCNGSLALTSAYGNRCFIYCMLPGEHIVHMARGASVQVDSQKNVNWKLIWEEER